jgi:N-acetylmuramoyl-L-alanine amidase
MKTIIQSLALGALFALSSAASAANFRTVVIDAGHGGHDNGGQWGRVYEKHLALDTAYRLEAKLKAMGYQTVMTRRSDYFVSLPQRVAMGNKYRNSIFVCIHYNFTVNQEANGLETFYYNQEGQRLSQYVQSNLIRRTGTTDRKAKFARFFVLRNSKQPAILVEGGFVSNTTERNRMKSATFRDQLAQGIADGIQRYRRD